MNDDSDFFRAIGIRPEHIPEPKLSNKAEVPGAEVPGACTADIRVRFDGDEATVSREDLARVVVANKAVHGIAVRWRCEAQREHGRAELYRWMSVALMLLCAAMGVWIGW